MTNAIAASLTVLVSLGAVACSGENPPSREAGIPPSSTPATAPSESLEELVKRFVAAIDKQEAILKRYGKDESTLEPGDAEPLWQASLDGEHALSQIAAMAKEHPEWKATIVQWWHAQIEPAHVRHFRANRHTLKSELLEQAAPDPEQLRQLLMRDLQAGVALDRLAKAVKAGVSQEP